MSNKGKTLEPPLKLDMGFNEALNRFAATKPNEVAANLDKEKSKGPPDKRIGLPSGDLKSSKNVASLRAARQSKRRRSGA